MASMARHWAGARPTRVADPGGRSTPRVSHHLPKPSRYLTVSENLENTHFQISTAKIERDVGTLEADFSANLVPQASEPC